MKNGYALCAESRLAAIDSKLREMTPGEMDALRDLLRIGLDWRGIKWLMR